MWRRRRVASALLLIRGHAKAPVDEWLPKVDGEIGLSGRSDNQRANVYEVGIQLCLCAENHKTSPVGCGGISIGSLWTSQSYCV